MDKITLPLEIKEFGQDDDNFTFEGHLAVFGNVDFGGDIIEPGAFSEFLEKSKSAGEKSIPIFWVHKSNEPVGIFPIEHMVEDAKGLFVKGIMPRSDTFVSGRVIPQMRVGSVAKMSIGYDAQDFEMDADYIRRIQKIHLWEGSLVPVAMNDEARITAMKAVVPFGDLPLAERTRLWDSTSAIGRVREWAGADGDGDLSDPDVQAKYKQAFFYYDRADADLFGAYKLPFADIIDGRLTAVPRGIFSAAAALQGARGGVFLPSEDRPGIVRNVEKYYEKMDMESPFSKAFRLDDLTCVDERTLEKILRSGARFSAKMAPAIISAIKSAGLRDEESKGLRDGEENAEAIVNEIDNVLKKIGGKNA